MLPVRERSRAPGGILVILAIVGTRQLAAVAVRYARLIISCEVTSDRWTSFITGDAGGIDKLTLDACQRESRACQVLIPEFRRWKPRGFMERNMKIAGTCDAMLCIRDGESDAYGSGWTADYCQKLGKPVTRVTIT
jgi:predicted Rossmann fold nucleotide-binding protein DprA/Smf involved in DNA uptake